MRILTHLLNIVVFISLFVCSACHWNERTGNPKAIDDSLSVRESLPPSPVVSPEESIEKMLVEKGSVVKLVAGEPMVNSPVALTFDDRGRMWVAEMEGYMPDTIGTGENRPTGKIVILEDNNGDGRMDTRNIFIDSLVLPRALCLVENGLLIAEPPNLWFVDIQHDKAGKKMLVDSAYAEGGNVEHQPNGLLRALDNWIYSANSGKRYRKKQDKWLIEHTHVRGQWGITQDDLGRMYYNNNSQNLLGDYFAPGLGAQNSNQRRVAGYNVKIVADNKVYPIRPTTGVNRGYMEGILDDSLRLVKFTAASGPLLYRGDLFDKGYYNNVFVPEPSANLIKRNVLTEDGYMVQGKQAYSGREFLASSDERFRPVNIYNGPDGAIYVVDMYRGIIQHKTYLTAYLKNEIKSRELDQPITCGRIYKIQPQDKSTQPVILAGKPDQLVSLLQHPNGWVRDKAQQMLVDGKFVEVVPALHQYLTQTAKPFPLIHALWTLEGLAVLQPGDVLPLLGSSVWPIRMQALSVLPSIMNKNNYQQFVPVLTEMLTNKDTLAAPYVAFLLQSIQAFNKSLADRLLHTIVKQYPDNIFVSDAVIGNLKNREADFLKTVMAANADTSLAINKQLQQVVYDLTNKKNNKDSRKLEKEFPKGYALFKSTCQTCHGADGNGIRSLAPPLNKSDWVTGNKDALISVVLYGLTGPVKVSGKLYEVPEVTGDMPGMGNNKDISDEDFAQLISFVRQSWSNNAEKINVGDITKIRDKYKARQKSFTMDELKKGD
ncbi:MAG: c-type cytochrome [Chitinophagaceae bacterium]